MKDIIDWANQNDGFIGLLTGIITLLLIPVFLVTQRILAKRLSSSVSPEEIERIERIRAQFYENLKISKGDENFGHFLIRDVARDRLYFDGDEKELHKNWPQPSFKVEVVDLSVHGVDVYEGFSAERIKRIEGDRWCLAESDDEQGIMAHPIGTIPFSSIVAINWHGDPATHFPHIFCHFDQERGGPYKRIEYARGKNASGAIRSTFR